MWRECWDGLRIGEGPAFPTKTQHVVLPYSDGACFIKYIKKRGGVQVLFPGDKAGGAWRWPPTLSSAEVTERVSYTSTLHLGLYDLF